MFCEFLLLQNSDGLLFNNNFLILAFCPRLAGLMSAELRVEKAEKDIDKSFR